MAFITQFYTWATGNTITAARLNGNISNIVDGLSLGTKDIKVAAFETTGTSTIGDDMTIAAGKAITTATSDTNTLLIQAYDVDGAAGTTFITLTAGNTPTCVFSGDITTTTQSQGDNSTKIATTAYVDAAVTAEDFWDRSGTTLSPNTANDNVDIGTGNYIGGGIFKIDVDGTAENAAGSLTLGAGNDAGIFFDGTDLVIITNGAGASGIILDSEDDTVEIKGSGTLQATFDTGGLNLVSGDTYEINGTSVLSATTLGTGVVTSSLTTVGALDSGSITSGFGAIDNGTSNITTGGILKIDVDGTAENAAGSLTLGAGNDAGIFFDGTNLVIITNGAGASGIILDSEDDTVEIKGSGTLQATFDTGGLDLVTGDEYSINGASVLSATTLGTSVVTSSLTTVGALDSGSITSGFGTINTGSSTITTTGAGTFGSVIVDNVTIDGNDVSSTSGNLTLTPVAGSAVVIDGAASFDAGVVTGITDLTVTGDLTVDTTTLYVDSANSRVGIGTITPSNLLDLQVGTSGNQYLLELTNFVSTSTGSGVGIKFTQGSQKASGSILAGRDSNYSGDSTADSNLQFYTSEDAVDAERMRISSSGRVGVSVSSPTAQFHIDQSSSTAAIPVVKLDQGDVSEPFIDYIGTSAASAANSLSSWTTGNSVQGHIQIDVNGTKRWLRFYDDPTS